MGKKNRLLTSAVALGTAAAMLMGGTFAWQSISQIAENETANIVNPGGRLHDDFDGKNKDIYVENFGDEPILARVRLEEYFALVINQGKDYAKTETKLGTETKNDNGSYTYTGDIYVFNEDNLKEEGGNTFLAGFDKDTGEYRWNWTVGSADSLDAYYMPTFNKNKDSLVADVNGWYKNGLGTFGTEINKTVADVITTRDSAQYEGYTTWKKNDYMQGNAIYDIDRNSADELAALSASDLSTLIKDGTGTYDQNAVKLVEESHDAQKIGTTNGLVSMADWLEMIETDGGYNNYDHGGYWVYDTDGWVYWSSLIQPGTATGRLLDGIKLNGVMNDSWYYAINVVAQFVTPDDLGKADSTGFYDTEAAGETPITESAEKLLSAMTAGTTFTLGLDANDIPTITVDPGTPITLALEGNANWESAFGDTCLDAGQFTIGMLSGEDFTKDETRAASDAAKERFTAGTYGTLDLNYAENTVTITLNKSAKITITDPDDNSVWQGMVQVNMDWSKFVTMKFLTKEDYQALWDATDGDNDIMHRYRLCTIVNTQLGNGEYLMTFSSEKATRDDFLNDPGEDMYSGIRGLRPAFTAADVDDCAGLSVGDVVVIGTLYKETANESAEYSAVKVPADSTFADDVAAYDPDYVSENMIGDTHPMTYYRLKLDTALEDTDYRMQAIYCGEGLFVCDRVMFTYLNVSQIKYALGMD